MWFVDSWKLKSTVWPIRFNQILMGLVFLNSNPQLLKRKPPYQWVGLARLFAPSVLGLLLLLQCPNTFAFLSSRASVLGNHCNLRKGNNLQDPSPRTKRCRGKIQRHTHSRSGSDQGQPDFQKGETKTKKGHHSRCHVNPSPLPSRMVIITADRGLGKTSQDPLKASSAST